MENIHEAAMNRRISRFAQREQRNQAIVLGGSVVATVVATAATIGYATTFVNGVVIFVAVWFYTGLALLIVVGTGVAINDWIEDHKLITE